MEMEDPMTRMPPRLLPRAALVALAASLCAPAAFAAEPPDVIALDAFEWPSDEMIWSADRIIDMDVRGANGEEVGEVEDIVIGPDNRIRFVVVETNAFLDIGDTHAAVAWDNVEIVDAVPMLPDLTEDMLDAMRDMDDAEFADSWRVRELIGDRVDLLDTPNYALVNDVIFTQDGEVAGIEIYPHSGYGPPAYPYYPYYGPGAEWAGGPDAYGMPYSRAQVEGSAGSQ
jgi:sporulation protein YlmC with PRC-barrel domain